MKRTAEIVLGIIGALIYGLFAALGGAMIWLQNNQDAFRESLEQTAEQNPDVAMGDFDTIMEAMGMGGWMITIASIIAIILGIVAMVMLRGNKNPTAAGIIFIITSVAFAIVTVGAGIIPGVFYLIAGIMCLVRKPPQMIES